MKRCKSKPKSGYGRPWIRFWKNVDKNGPVHPVHGQCWNWIGGSRTKSGYGCISIQDKPVRVHRYSWMLHNGGMPEDYVLHKCDNRLCVNPKHLFLGSAQDNADDMVSKGRSLKGEAHSGSKLTDAQVLEIRGKYVWHCSKNGSYGLAKQYSVGQFTIVQIVNRRTWTHI